MSRARVRAWVSGDVQGVGYRWFVSRLADRHGLAGSATNLPDGRVEVVLEGPEEVVRTAVRALSGPGAPGRVGSVDQRDEDAGAASGFTMG